MYAYIILNNMILGDERRVICRYEENKVLPNVGIAIGTHEYRENRIWVYDCGIHDSLSAELVEHIYRARIEPQAKYWHIDLFEKSDEDSDFLNLDLMKFLIFFI